MSFVFRLHGLALALLAAGSAGAQTSARELAELSLEQLVNVDVTSVSKRVQRLSDVAASVFVISAEDIRRSGATSLPEALRLAPNLQVARADANQYAITARGFNAVLANKMLVLIDGRTAYSPLFSGVFWEAQDVVLEDVERIEVLSGSGGTLYGSNAVNGVINIIMRSASDTHGLLVAAGGGSQDNVETVRYGGETGGGASYRVYGRHSGRDNTAFGNGTPIRDASARTQVGFRTDWPGQAHSSTLQGDFYESRIEQAPAGNARRISGFNLLGRHARQLDDGASAQVQVYYDRTNREQPGALNDTLDTLDAEFQHQSRPTASQQLLWGAGYRIQFDRVDNINPAALALIPADRRLKLAHVFAQDEIALQKDLSLTLGLKLEHNVYTGTEFLPSARLAWVVRPDHLLWTAASRTVRTPSRVDREFFVPGVAPFSGSAGGATFQSEVAHVYELGYRGQPVSAVSYSVALFHHAYEHLRSLEPTPAGPTTLNNISGTGNGMEAWGSWRVASWWRLGASATVLRQRLQLDPGSASLGGVAALGNDAQHRGSVSSSFELGPALELDIAVRRVGALPAPAVPAYTAIDARLGWHVRPGVELSFTGRNLGDARHPEWGPAANRAEIERSWFVNVVWRLK